ncbi:MAG: AAA family ATPase, partial [Oscillospiraceae bacterium]|nr:AAA family ATPase [Oscillospiraceae bacterium]
MIKRDFYLNQIFRHMHNGEIKVITGIRRCGKSVLLFELFRDYLMEQGVAEEQIITIELDQRKYYKFRNPITLCEYVESIVTVDKARQYYLFIDEVQFTKKVKDLENDGIE